MFSLVYLLVKSFITIKYLYWQTPTIYTNLRALPSETCRILRSSVIPGIPVFTGLAWMV
jgi:hypothetical protein